MIHIPKMTITFRLKRFARRHARWLILPLLAVPCIGKGYADRQLSSPVIERLIEDATAKG